MTIPMMDGHSFGLQELGATGRTADFHAKIVNTLKPKSMSAGPNFTVRPKATVTIEVREIDDQPSTVLQLFRDQVDRQPDSPAVQIEDGNAVTYQELDQLSDGYAQLLGNQTGKIVPVALAPSLHLIVAIFGVMKAGAAYVVIDPSGAVERCRYMVKDTGTDTVITTTDHTASFSSVRVVDANVLSRQELLDLGRDHRTSRSVDESSLAYVVYTSGSTGVPKGVMITHGAAARGIEKFNLHGGRRWLLLYNPTFSAAQRTMLATLCKGACLCLASRGRMLGGLTQLIASMRIDALGITPSMLATLSPEDVPSCLTQITTVGESLQLINIDSWVSKIKQFRVSYGLSECAQLNMSRKLELGDNHRLLNMPSDTTSAFVMRQNTFSLANVNEPGELCLAGRQLATGYLGMPDETSKRFVIHPVSGERLYRTRDLAMIHANGRIELLGRVDRQVKLNGQRLELDEVSSVLSACEKVVAATTIMARINDMDALVAAIVTQDDAQLSSFANKLRDFSAEHLNSYMIPSYWIQYDTDLPRNMNGKLDWATIKVDAERRAASSMLIRGDQNHSAELDTIAYQIRDEWALALSMPNDDIGSQDSFLSLGGSSMQAIVIVNKLRKINLHVSLEAMLRNNTLSEVGQDSLEIAVDDPANLLRPFALVDLATSEALSKQSSIINAYPVTEFQQSVLAPTLGGSQLYTYQRVWQVSHCDLDRLRDAFATVFSQREIFRTTFNSTGTKILQTVRSDLSLPWQELTMPIDQYQQEDLKKGFELGSLFFRIALLNNSLLVITMHHALFDYYSHQFLYEDVASLYYNHALTARPGFDSFVGHAISIDEKAHEKFWREFLSSASETILNPEPICQANIQQRTIQQNTAQLSRKHGVPLSSIIYTAWASVLSQHTATASPTFAITVSGRERPVRDVDLIDGPTVTIVPCSIDTDPAFTWRDTLRKYHEQSLDVIKYSQYGLRRSLHVANKESPLLDSLVNIVPTRTAPENVNVDEIFKFDELRPRSSWHTEFITLQVEDQGERLSIHLSGCMEQSRLNFILASFERALRCLESQADIELGTVNLMTDEEVEFLTCGQPKPPSRLHHLLSGFDQIVQVSPTTIALQWEDSHSFDYATLNVKANQFAQVLNLKGVHKGHRVCLLLDKSPEMIIAIVAVLKQGASYIPLSPENPVQRNQLIIDDVAASLLISTRDIEQVLSYKNVLYLTDFDLADFSSEPPQQSIVANDEAYIIYTSGSTGIPKGVIISHGAAAAAVESMVAFEGRDKGTWRALQLSNYIFDASVLDIFNTLSSGGTLCMASNDRLLSDLPAMINMMGVTHSFMTPTVLRLLEPKEIPTLRSMVIGGESLSNELIAKWAADHQFIQAYGPTETSMVAFMKVMNPDSSARNLGKAFATTQAFILQREGAKLVPYGSVGELCLGGYQLGKGYLKRPELNAKSFPRLQIGRLPAARVYRTGDLGRWLPSGEFQYLGRKDHQVKVNGHRIELGEIESAIFKTDLVADCVTIVAEVEGKLQLSAFVVFEHGEEKGIQLAEQFVDRVTTLRERLQSLAHYMHPKFVLPLAVMPLTPSGKADRRMLATWLNEMHGEALAAYSLIEFGRPMSSNCAAAEPVVGLLEEIVADGFRQVLFANGQGSVGRSSNFLSLGGDSISAINLASLLRKHGYQLNVSQVLRKPLLKDLATELTIIRPICGKSTQNEAVDFGSVVQTDLSRQLHNAGVSSDDVEYVYPCPPGQSEFLDQGARSEKMWVCMTVRPLSSDAYLWLCAAKELTKTNDILRTTFTRAVPNGQNSSLWIGVVLKNSSMWTFEDPEVIFVADGASREEALNMIWDRNFQFGRPFIHYTILHHANGQLEVVVKMDHGLYDGSLLRIWESHFRAIQSREEVPTFTNFRDFAFLALNSSKTKTKEFWKLQLAGSRTTFPALPLEDYRPCANTTISVEGRIDNNAISAAASKANVTIPIIFQAAFQLWLAGRASGPYGTQLDRSGPINSVVSFDYLHTGRNVDLPQPDSINGPCATFVPIRVNQDTALSLTEYASLTQNSFWEATDNATLSLREIYASAGLDRDRDGNRIMFLYQPFEPPRKTQALQTYEQFVSMAGSRVRMLQPYAVVCQVKKTASNHLVHFTFDEHVFTRVEVLEGIHAVWKTVDRLCHDLLHQPDATVGDITRVA